MKNFVVGTLLIWVGISQSAFSLDYNYPVENVKNDTPILWMRLSYPDSKNALPTDFEIPDDPRFPISLGKKAHFEIDITLGPKMEEYRASQLVSTPRRILLPIKNKEGKIKDVIAIINTNIKSEISTNNGNLVQLDDGSENFSQLSAIEKLLMNKFVLRIQLGQDSNASALWDLFEKLSNKNSIGSKKLVLEAANLYLIPAVEEVADLNNLNPEEKKFISDRVKRLFYQYLSSEKNIVNLRNKISEIRCAIGKQTQNCSESVVESDIVIHPILGNKSVEIKRIEIGDDNLSEGFKSRRKNRIKIAVIGDGYRIGDGENFHKVAKEKMEYIFGAKSSMAPYNMYRDYFAIYSILVYSDGIEKDLDNPNDIGGIFGTYHGHYNIDRLLGMSGEGRQFLNDVLKKVLPDYDYAVVISNSKKYGGAGGEVPLVSANSNADEVLAHELFGHTFGKLGDEYTNPYPGYPDTEEPNTTKEPYLNKSKWSHWVDIEGSDLLKNFISEKNLYPENFVSKITHEEGAHYHKTEWFRPSMDCKMRSLRSPFCLVCQESIISQIYSKVSPIDVIYPEDTIESNKVHEIDISNNSSYIHFQIVKMRTVSPLAVSWTLNGKEVELLDEDGVQTEDLNKWINEGKVSKGKLNVISVTVKDITPLVSGHSRNRVENPLKELLEKQVRWAFKVIK